MRRGHTHCRRPNSDGSYGMGSNDGRTGKQKARDELQRLVEEYRARGGEGSSSRHATDVMRLRGCRAPDGRDPKVKAQILLSLTFVRTESLKIRPFLQET
jgi:hypothetical protein